MHAEPGFLDKLRATPINWIRADKCVYTTVVEGKLLKLRLNNFPEEPAVTLFFDGRDLDIENPPAIWSYSDNA